MDRSADNESPALPGDIIQTIENALFFIPVISPGYVNSKRCTRELNTFQRATANSKDTAGEESI